jgi:Ca2+-binding RTX toxin-like protein
LTGGLSADVLTGGAGADTFVYTSASVAASNGTTFDSITDWTSAIDKLEVTLDYSALTSALTIDATRASAGVAGVSAAQDVLSGSRGQYVYDTTNSVVLINVNNDNLFTTSDFRIGLVAGSTASATVASDGSDINFVITGGNLADVITTGGGADTIVGSAGGDSITGGGGIDVISGGSGTDTVVVGTVQTSVDSISTFTSGTDKVRYSGSLLNNATATLLDAGDISTFATVDAAIGASATARQYVFSNAAFDIDASLTAFLASPTATTAAAVTTAAMTTLNATTKTLLDGTFLATETVLFILGGTTGTSGAVFSFNNANAAAAGNTIDAGELVLVGVTDVVLVDGDIIL